MNKKLLLLIVIGIAIVSAVVFSSCSKEASINNVEKPVYIQLVDGNGEAISNQVYIK